MKNKKKYSAKEIILKAILLIFSLILLLLFGYIMLLIVFASFLSIAKEYHLITILVLELVILFVLIAYPIIETIKYLIKKKEFLIALLFSFVEIVLTYLFFLSIFFFISVISLFIEIVNFSSTYTTDNPITVIALLIIVCSLVLWSPYIFSVIFTIFEKIGEGFKSISDEFIKLADEELDKEEKENDENNNNIQ